MNILETKAYELADELKATVFMNWMGMQGLLLIKESQMRREKMKNFTRAIFCAKPEI